MGHSETASRLAVYWSMTGTVEKCRKCRSEEKKAVLLRLRARTTG